MYCKRIFVNFYIILMVKKFYEIVKNDMVKKFYDKKFFISRNDSEKRRNCCVSSQERGAWSST